ncbi:MAG: DUF4125 family protein [Desulfobacterales bacterium]|nr:DUF4125 family protein [Desulfobacterales bacterium]
MGDVKELIEDILNLEWDMFQNVKSETPASCQQMPDNFRRIRGSLFEVWNEETLESYRLDLQKAALTGDNLLTLKYARMDNRIAPLKGEDSLKKIREIVEIETRWQSEIQQKFPTIYNRMGRSTDQTGDGSNFSIYLACELETHGDKTIDLYHQGIKRAESNQINLALKSLEILLQKGGYRDLAHAESHLAGKGV